jgi:hypothetical protein
MVESVDAVLERIQDTTAPDRDGEVTLDLSVFHDGEEWVIGQGRPLIALDPRPRTAAEDAIEELGQWLNASLDRERFDAREVHGDGGQLRMTDTGEIVDAEFIDWPAVLSDVDCESDQGLVVRQDSDGDAFTEVVENLY